MAHILIADDVALARDALARALREHGHRVTVVADGYEALERFQRERPELFIVDMMMPRMGGIECCRRARSTGGAFVPTIVISARADVETKVSALAVAEDFVAKPYDVQELCARADAHLRTRKLLEEALAARTTVPAIPTATGSGAAPGAPSQGRSDEAAPQPAAGGDVRPGRASRSPSIPPRLLDRDQFVERLHEEWQRSHQSTEPLTLLIAGVDSAPVPGATDAPVAPLVAALQRSLRGQDAVARVDEVHAAGLLLNTHMTGSMAVAQRLRRELRRVGATMTTPFVVSMGFTFFPNREVNEPNDMLRLAERAIHRAREEGPGHICLWQHQGYLFEPPE